MICRTWFTGSGWQTETVDATLGTGENSCLVIDDADRIRVAEADVIGTGSAMAVDPAGRVFVAYDPD